LQSNVIFLITFKVSNVIKVFDYKYSEIHNLLKILNLLNTKTLLFIMNL